MPTSTRPRSHAVHAAIRSDPRTDAELIDHFVLHVDHAAFATLVHRHGPLVYGVCRRALGPTADADDAFQATFLVLVRKTGAMTWRANLGPWLYGVAVQVTRKARFKRDRRFAVEKQVNAMPHPEAPPSNAPESDELSRAFDEELAALPEDMRRALVLCELQGRSRQQAAKELRISEGTLSSRLARARKLLRDRLGKRGFTLMIPTSALVSAKLTAATVGLTSGTVGVVPTTVIELAQEALKAMTISKLKLGAVLTAVAIGFTGFGLTAQGGGADPQVKPVATTAKVTPPPVATINGDEDISREEFAEHLIRKYGAKEIELFVNKKIIEAEAKKRGVSVTEKEVELSLSKDLQDLTVEKNHFVKVVLPKYGKTEAEWREDVLRPRLQLEKLIQGDVKVTDDDLKKLFERKYGEKRVVKVVAMGYGGNGMPETLKLQSGEERVPARSVSESTTDAAMGRNWTITRHMSVSDMPVVDAVFALSKVGDTTENIAVPNQDRRYQFMLVEVIPPQRGKKFEDEKAMLLVEATREKVQAAIPKLFAKLKQQSKPLYHLQPEPKNQSATLPPKK